MTANSQLHPVFGEMFDKIFGQPKTSAPDPISEEAPADLIGSYTRLLSEMRPDNLDVLQLGNEAIDEVRDSALAAEDRGELPRTDYGRLTLEQIYEGHVTAERR